MRSLDTSKNVSWSRLIWPTLYNGPLLCAFNMAIKGLKTGLHWRHKRHTGYTRFPRLLINLHWCLKFCRHVETVPIVLLWCCTRRSVEFQSLFMAQVYCRQKSVVIHVKHAKTSRTAIAPQPTVELYHMFEQLTTRIANNGVSWQWELCWRCRHIEHNQTTYSANVT